MKLGGILGRRKSGEKAPEGGNNPSELGTAPQKRTDPPITVNYAAADALRQGVRAFQVEKEAMKESDTSSTTSILLEEQGENASGGGDGFWDVFESEKEEDPYAQAALAGLEDVDIFDLLEKSEEVANRLQRGQSEL